MAQMTEERKSLLGGNVIKGNARRGYTNRVGGSLC